MGWNSDKVKYLGIGVGIYLVFRDFKWGYNHILYQWYEIEHSMHMYVINKVYIRGWLLAPSFIWIISGCYWSYILFGVSITFFSIIIDISKFKQYVLCYLISYYSILIMFYIVMCIDMWLSIWHQKNDVTYSLTCSWKSFKWKRITRWNREKCLTFNYVKINVTHLIYLSNMAIAQINYLLNVWFFCLNYYYFLLNISIFWK